MNLFKTEIRELVRPLRRLITPEYRQTASQAAARHFVASPFFQESQHVACYSAVADEFDATPLIEALWQAGKACYLPVLAPGDDKKLHFVLYEKGMKLTPNRYRVLEPQQPWRERPAEELDLVLLPLVAFDGKGSRLGTGGGYYDRTFAFMLESGQTARKKPQLWGLAYELQRVDKIPREKFDVPLQGIVTEERIDFF